jgi:ribosomal protein L14E/L6E/L27E
MVGKIVCSKAGRDKGYFMVVVKCENGFLYVCDGKERPLEHPKRKNEKHLQFTNTVLTENSYKTNKQLKKALAVYRDTAKFKEEP